MLIRDFILIKFIVEYNYFNELYLILQYKIRLVYD